VERRVAAGDVEATLVCDAMIDRIAKAITGRLPAFDLKKSTAGGIRPRNP